MNTYFPDLKAFWAAENVTATIHNIYTLRGALVRDALEWSNKIGEALYLFGQEADVMFASHSWPRWGTDRIQEVLRSQRDAYAHLNNHVLHLANQGVTINGIRNRHTQPRSLQAQWSARSYHGSEEHNSRAVINRYLGYWDGNPATLIPLSPSDSAPLFVEMMGGPGPILTKGRELYDEGRYLDAVEILNKLVYAEPDNEDAKMLLADNFEQIGYQQESSSVRNSFLSGAYELRSRIPTGVPPAASGPDLMWALTTEMFSMLSRSAWTPHRSRMSRSSPTSSTPIPEKSSSSSCRTRHSRHSLGFRRPTRTSPLPSTDLTSRMPSRDRRPSPIRSPPVLQR